MKSKKYDTDKLQYDLLPPECIKAVVDILTFGAKKYEAHNWKKLPNAKERYYNALMRHVEQWRMGEKIDSESKRLALAHVATNAMFLLWFDLNSQ